MSTLTPIKRGLIALDGFGCIALIATCLPQVAGAAAGLLVFAAVIVVWLVPAIVAYRRHHRNTQAILALDFFLGWTGIGWVAALVWALTDDTKEAKA
jgi:membrane protein YdbS with pleckstrin-like domain